jgi:PhnB protein
LEAEDIMVKAIPEGTRTVTPHLVIKGADKAVDFYTRAFGAREHYRMGGPGGLIGHAELQIGDSLIYLADEWPGPQGGSKSPQTLKGSSVNIHLFVEDVDSAFQRAVGAGAKVVMPLMDMFWGDRYGQVRDPFGHVWSLATHKEDLSPDEMARRGQEAMAAMPSPGPARKKSARAAQRAKKAGGGSRKTAKGRSRSRR